jgi:putative ABC transport system permease protein
VLLKLAFRNVFRQRRRSLLTGLTMAGGFVLLSLSISISEGTYDTAINTFTTAFTGHMQVHARGYLDQPTLFKTLTGVEALGAKVAAVPGVRTWTPRVYAGVLAFAGTKTTVARLIGVDPVREPKTLKTAERIAQGSFFSGPEAREALIGPDLAEVLGLKLGGELVLITQGADGSVANDLFTVRGVLTGGGMAAGNQVYVPLAAAQEFLALPGRVHELIVMLDDFSRSRRTARAASAALADPALEVEPWEVTERSFYHAMTLDKEGMWLFFLIIVAIVAVGVLNTVLMTVLERTREYGILKALGTRPRDLFRLIVLETGILALLATALAALVSLGVDAWFVRNGILYAAGADMGGVIVDTLYGSLKARCFTQPALITLGTALIVSIFPALRVVRIRPVNALRD